MRDVCLMHLLLLLVLAATAAMPHNRQQQQHHQLGNDVQRMDNEYTPIIHISSAVLQLAPDEQTHLLLSGSGHGHGNGHSGSSQPTGPIAHWPHIYRLEDLLPVRTPAAAEPRLTVSDNLDFQANSPQYVQSHGR
ncbi:uncharacterized protein LOC111603136 [Drosophila hydei]|uniref:Uncharacterized protein LOC111603136 n=1 Tax=Drosophila hydei TaxID=7224 RepID=A0A6J1MAV4_DROHY|nr:uncharacterized protein LOC111603136 [Drosophila hydei]